LPFFFAALTGRAEKALQRADIKSAIGEGNFFPRLHDAIQAVLNNEIHLSPKIQPSEKQEGENPESQTISTREKSSEEGSCDEDKSSVTTTSTIVSDEVG